MLVTKSCLQRNCKKTASAQGKFIRQSGGRGQFGDVTLRIEPLEAGSVFFLNQKLLELLYQQNIMVR